VTQPNEQTATPLANDLFCVRRAVVADAPRLPAVERSAARAFLNVPGLEWLADSPVQPVQRIGELIEGGNAWVAASGRGDILGFLVAERRGDGLHIWEVSVMPAQQGQGIGRQLIAAAVCAAREQRLARVTLTTFSDVPWNRPFYERLGFVCQPERESAAWLSGIAEQERAQGLTQRCIMALAIGR